MAEREAMEDRTLLVFALFLLMTCGTMIRAEQWNDPLSFWQDASDHAPKHARPRLNIALLLMERKRFREAAGEYRAVLRDLQIDRAPIYQANARNGALINLGLIEAIEGRYDLSERYLSLVIAEWPNLMIARMNRAMARYAGGDCLGAQEDVKALKCSD